MKCIVVDDEPLAREGMELMIREVQALRWSDSFSNVLEADNYLRHNPVDLIFLDIQMPQLSGLDYLRTRSPLPQVILTTAFPQYALDGFELDVTDYLVKPIRFERFYKAVAKALVKHESPRRFRDTVETEDGCVFVRADKKFIRVAFADVLFVEGAKDYSVLHLQNEKIMVAINLRNVQPQLPSSYFMRVGKSHIVNLTRIDRIDRDCVFVGNAEIPIGDSYREMLMNYVERTGVLRRNG